MSLQHSLLLHKAIDNAISPNSAVARQRSRHLVGCNGKGQALLHGIQDHEHAATKITEICPEYATSQSGRSNLHLSSGALAECSDNLFSHLALHGLIEHCPSMHVAHGHLCILADPSSCVGMICFRQGPRIFCGDRVTHLDC